MQRKFIIDTDVGTDLDDALALLYAFKSDMEILAITLISGAPKADLRSILF